MGINFIPDFIHIMRLCESGGCFSIRAISTHKSFVNIFTFTHVRESGLEVREKFGVTSSPDLYKNDTNILTQSFPVGTFFKGLDEKS